jgi:hypothetical protein
MREADYILVEENLFEDWTRETLEAGPYELVTTTPQTSECRADSRIFIYREIP